MILTKYSQKKKRKKFRLITRREQWTLTAQGWAVLLAIVAASVFFVTTYIHSFLAVTSPIKADLLVVEGWIPDYAVEQALVEFQKGSYQKVVTTGIPLERGFYLAQYNNYAELAAATLKALGLEENKIVAVATPDVRRDRTYASAIAFRQWLIHSKIKINSINLYSHDVHARRSWLSFKQVLAPDIKVGIIASEAIDYDRSKWWSSSTGVRKVISEAVAYIYARLTNISS